MRPYRQAVLPVTTHPRPPAGIGIIAATPFDHARKRTFIHIRANHDPLAGQHDPDREQGSDPLQEAPDKYEAGNAASNLTSQMDGRELGFE